MSRILFTGGGSTWAGTPLSPGPGTPPRPGTPPWTGTPPRQVHPLGPGTPPWDQVYPLDQVHSPRQVHPLDQVPPRTRYTPLGRYIPWDQVHPPEQCMLGDAGNKRAVRILLECILVCEFFRMIGQRNYFFFFPGYQRRNVVLKLLFCCLSNRINI